MAKYKRKRRKKFSSWRKLKVSRKIRHRLKIFGLALLVVFCTIVVSGAVALYQFFNKPMAGATGASEGGVVVSGDRFNLLLINLEDADEPTSLIKELSIISIGEAARDLPTLPAGRQGCFPITLPLEVEVVVPQGFGGHKLKEVYSLGALTKPQANLDLTALTVKKLLAVPIDGYIVTDDAGLGQISKYLGGGLRLVRLLPNLFTEVRRQIKTNLSFPTLLRVGQMIWSSKSSGDVWHISREELFDWQHLDLKLAEHFMDSKIVEERLKIQVLNGTEKQGLATHVSRYVKNLGGDVIVIGNYEQTDLKQSFFVLPEADLENLHTVERLKEVLQIDDIRPGQNEVEKRADLTIVLGLDSWKNL